MSKIPEKSGPGSDRDLWLSEGAQRVCGGRGGGAAGNSRAGALGEGVRVKIVGKTQGNICRFRRTPTCVLGCGAPPAAPGVPGRGRHPGPTSPDSPRTEQPANRTCAPTEAPNLRNQGPGAFVSIGALRARTTRARWQGGCVGCPRCSGAASPARRRAEAPPGRRLHPQKGGSAAAERGTRRGGAGGACGARPGAAERAEGLPGGFPSPARGLCTMRTQPHRPAAQRLCRRNGGPAGLRRQPAAARGCPPPVQGARPG
jgi:hypothetical protein